MVTEQIIEFESRRLVTLVVWYSLTGYFLDKTKISQANLQRNYYLLLKTLLAAMYFAPPFAPSRLLLYHKNAVF